MHKPRPYGLLAVGGELTDEDRAAVELLARRLTNIKQFGIESNADQVGLAATGLVGGAVAVHAAVSALKRAQKKTDEKVEG